MSLHSEGDSRAVSGGAQASATIASASPPPSSFPRGLAIRLYPVLTELWQLLDAAAVGVAMYFVTLARGGQFGEQHVLLIAVTTVLMFAVYSWSDLFYRLRTRSLPQEAGRLLRAWAIVLVSLMAIAYLAQMQHLFPRSFVLAWGAAGYCAQLVVHVVVRKTLHFLRRRGYNIRSVLVVGCGAPLERHVRLVERNPWLGFQIEGYVAEPEWLAGPLAGPAMQPGAAATDGSTGNRLATDAGRKQEDAASTGGAVGAPRLLGGLSDIERLVDTLSISEIYVALPLERAVDAEVAMRALVNVPVNVNWLPDFSVAQVLSMRADELDGQSVVLLSDSRIERHGVLVKRFEDLLVSAFLLVLLAPLLAVIACAIKYSSPGPVLFKQLRHGIGGQRITVWKFRTMRVGGQTELKQAVLNDDRVTPIGRLLRRWSLDELPQFFNVLQGSMSLVGPRPHPVWLNDGYSQVINNYMQRHRVKPGLTGWAQVNGCRGETDTREKMEQRVNYDLYYITHWSPWLDLRILARTIVTVLRGDNAY